MKLPNLLFLSFTTICFSCAGTALAQHKPANNDTCFYSIHIPADMDKPGTPHYDTTIVRKKGCKENAIRFDGWGFETNYVLSPANTSSIKGFKERSAHFFMPQQNGAIDITDLAEGIYSIHLMACGNGGFFTVRIK